MKRLRGIALTVALSAMGAAHADPVPASAESIHQLMEVTHVAKLMDNMMVQMKSAIQQSALQAAGHPLDPQEQKILARGMDNVAELMRAQMAWSKLEPAFTDIYRKNFSQKEIDDLLAFYETPSGQAMISKMPEVMQEGMQVGLAQARAAMPQIQKINQDMLRELKEYEATKGNQGS